MGVMNWNSRQIKYLLHIRCGTDPLQAFQRFGEWFGENLPVDYPVDARNLFGQAGIVCKSDL